MFYSLIAVQDRLNAHEILTGIPHDGPAFIVYALVLGFIYMIWLGSRPKKGK